MLVLIPILLWILCFLGWDYFRLPVEFDRILAAALIFSAITCAIPLRKIFQRAQPMGMAGKFSVFTLFLLYWFAALAPLFIIFNIKFDPSTPAEMEREVLEVRERGPGVCVVRVDDWKTGAGDRWLWLDCKEPLKVGEKARYALRRGALGFAWVSSNTSGM